jgi:hypothetical protein
MVLLASGAHAFGGGVLPEPGIMVLLFVLALVPVTLLAGRRITAPVMAVLLCSSQLILHEAFDTLSTASGFMPARGEHVHGLGAVLPAAAAGMGMHAAVPGVLMLVAHAVATLVTALVLAKGETALWMLAAWLRPLIQLPDSVVLHPLPRPAAFFDVFVPSRWRNLRLPAERGPPLAAAL